MEKVLPKEIQVMSVNNKDWNSYKKLWKRLKIVRNEAMLTTDPQFKKEKKDEEIEISRKIVNIAKTLTDGKGVAIAVPMFPILGSNQ
jgi:hypothetical protein